MSRIQEILAKAERDGTVRRTQATGTASAGPAPAAFPPARPELVDQRVAGTSALDTASFAPSLTPSLAANAAAAAPAVVLRGTRSS